jgi:hypothetical protein
VPEGPFTHVCGPVIDSRQKCSRCGLLIAARPPGKPQGALVQATGTGRWRTVEMASKDRPLCSLAGEMRPALASMPPAESAGL